MTLTKNIINRVFSVLLASILICTGMPSLVSAEGEAAVIIISTPGDFAALSRNCVYDSYSKGMQVTLINDIDMSGIEFEPMKIFCGTFDGGGHYIRNLKLDFDGSAKGMCFELGQGGEIRNLNVQGSVKSKSSGDAATTVDEIIGSVAKNSGVNPELVNKNSSVSILGGIVGTNSGRIINCSFDGSIEGETAVGGIVGENRDGGYVELCYNVSSVLGKQNTGGIVGRNYGWVKSCKNDGRINSSPVEDSHNIGGIAGMNDGVVEASVNNAEIGYKNVGINIGGIAGKQSGCVLECQNTGAVLGSKSVGGIVGRFEPYTEITTEDLDELRENIKGDVDETRQNIKNDITDYQDRLNTDINGILDRFGSGSLGTGLLGTLAGLYGAKSSLSDTINLLGESHSDLIYSIRDELIPSLSDSARDISNNIGNLTDSGAALLDTLNDETRGTLGDTVDSLNDTIDTVYDASNSLETLLGDIDSLVVDINDAYNSGDLNTLSDRLDNLGGRLDYIQDVILYPMSSSVTSAMNSLTRTLNSLRSDASDITDALIKPLTQLQILLREAQSEINKLNSDIDRVQNEIDRILEDIHKLLEDIDDIEIPYPSSVPSYSPSIPGLFGKALSDLFFMPVYADETVNLSEDEIKSELKDVTNVDISTPRDVSGMPTDNAVVIYCVNSGNVSGESDIGGICGTIGIESAIRNGKNLTLQNGTILTSSSIVKAVISGCISECEISSKSGYAGGIAGDSYFGIIKNSAASGTVDAEESSHAGGIAGYSGGKINQCIAITDLEGKSYIGGIAGEADEITTCYALPRISGSPEKSGAITGTAEGIVLNNYFIKEGLSGINGADFDGKAVALEWNEITGIGTIPEAMKGFNDDTWYVGSDDIFLPQNRVLSDNTASSVGALIKARSAEMARFHFKVEFIIDDVTVKDMVVDYNTVLDPSEVPQLETRDGYCPQWSRDTKEPIRRNTKFRAEYIDAVKTIGTDEEPPLLLVDGNFKEDSSVRAWETDPVGEYDRNYSEVAAYGFEISPEYSGKIRVHIRDKDGKGNYIGVVRGGKTRILEAERDGSYLVFELDEPSEFTILHKRSNGWKIAGIIMLALGVLIFIFILVKRRLDSGNSEKPDSVSDTADEAEDKAENKEISKKKNNLPKSAKDKDS